MSRPKKAMRSERGQALLEFAAILPIILIFLLMLVDFGIAIDHRQVIQHAVREGARHGAVGLSESGITDSVVANSGENLDAGDVEVCYANGPSGEPAGTAGSVVRVSGTYTYDFSLGSGAFLEALGIGPLTVEMTPSAEGRLETSVTGASEC
jgi:Flp pilus assembly protein TadG